MGRQNKARTPLAPCPPILHPDPNLQHVTLHGSSIKVGDHSILENLPANGITVSSSNNDKFLVLGFKAKSGPSNMEDIVLGKVCFLSQQQAIQQQRMPLMHNIYIAIQGCLTFFCFMLNIAVEL